MRDDQRLEEGLAALRAGDCAAAAARLEALACQSDRAEPWLYLGLARERLGDLEGAAEALLRAQALDPLAAATHYSLGRLYERLAKPAEAVTCYRAALAQDRHHQPSRLRLDALDPGCRSAALERPLAPKQRLQAIDPVSATRLSLTLATMVAVMLLTGVRHAGPPALAVASAADSACVGALVALHAGVVVALAGPLFALFYNLTVTWRGAASLRLGLAGRWTVVEEVDPYPFAHATIATLLALLLFSATALFPSLLAVGRHLLEGQLGALTVLSALLTAVLLGLGAACGVGFAGVMTAVALYHRVQRLTGGLRFRYRDGDGWSQAEAVALAPLTGTGVLVLAPLTLPVCLVLGGGLWLSIAASRGTAADPGHAEWAVMPLLLLFLLLPLLPAVAGLSYNIHAAVAGGLRFSLEDE